MVIRRDAKRMFGSNRHRDALRRATALVRRVCDLAASPSLIDDARDELRKAGVIDAIRRHDDAKLYEWLLDAISYQGISDAVARRYMDEHGRVRHAEVISALAASPACSKLRSWWHFEGCSYRKWTNQCSEPRLIESCSLPSYDLRNGNLNQAAFSLALFIRDVAGGDLVNWIDNRLARSDHGARLQRGGRLASSVIEPLRHVYGVSDKVLNMSLATLLLGGDSGRPRWIAAGTNMIAVDSLVHNWLTRTGILRSLRAGHAYGDRCYAEHGCAAIITQISNRIDARKYNTDFPRRFPRFVQHAIWRFCAQSGLDECNGNRVKDSERCQRKECDLYTSCKRVKLSASPPKQAP